MYRILIVGCGYTGTAIGHYFRQKKQKVWGLIRSPERKSELGKHDITPILADLTKPETLRDIPDVSFVVIAVAPDERSDKAYREIYLDGVRNFLTALRNKFPPSLIVYLSSTGVYGDKKGAWVDEETVPGPDDERGRILLEAESQVLDSGFPSVVLRLGGIYGPERNILKRLKTISVIKEEPDGYINMIHVEDIALMMPVILKKAEAGSIYLGVDDEPVLRSEFYDWIAKTLSLRGGEADEAISQLARLLRPYGARNDDSNISGKRSSNKKLKSLGYTFKYPTFREGYAASLAPRPPALRADRLGGLGEGLAPFD